MEVVEIERVVYGLKGTGIGRIIYGRCR